MSPISIPEWIQKNFHTTRNRDTDVEFSKFSIQSLIIDNFLKAPYIYLMIHIYALASVNKNFLFYCSL